MGLEEVIFIPAAAPPHKTGVEIIEASHRFEMIRLAIRTNPHFSVSDAEINRRGKSYSVDTILQYGQIDPASLYFILGEDAFREIETWKKYQVLFSLCHFVVMTRPNREAKRRAFRPPDSLVPFFRYDPDLGAWIHESGRRLFFKEITLLDISSTAIRERILEGASVRYLLPPEVEAYIRGNGLYRHTHSRGEGVFPFRRKKGK